MNLILIALVLKYAGDWNQVFAALERKEKISDEELKSAQKHLDNQAYEVITILDANYPKAFHTIYKPPFCLWVKGQMKLEEKPIVCVAGNQLDPLTLQRIKTFIPQLERHYQLIVPGFAGVDQVILKQAQKTLMHVLPCGIHQWKKPSTQAQYISEYPPHVKPAKALFRNRNRLIAGLATKLILFSSEKNGKINNLVTEFLNLGKEIFVFAGDGGEHDGNSDLIKQGANLITSLKDLELTYWQRYQ